MLKPARATTTITCDGHTGAGATRHARKYHYKATPAAAPQAAALALDAGTLTGMADAEWDVERHLQGKPAEVVALYHHFTRLVSACGPFTYSVSKSAITFKGARRGFAGGAHLSGTGTPAMRP